MKVCVQCDAVEKEGKKTANGLLDEYVADLTDGRWLKRKQPTGHFDGFGRLTRQGYQELKKTEMPVLKVGNRMVLSYIVGLLTGLALGVGVALFVYMALKGPIP